MPFTQHIQINRLQPSTDLGHLCTTHHILVPFGTEVLNLANNSANQSNFHVSSFYSCRAGKFLKGENRAQRWHSLNPAFPQGRGCSMKQISFVEKIIPSLSFSFCTKMSKLPCLVGQRHFISKFRFCFVVLQLYIYPSSQWNDVSQVHHCKNKYQMRCLAFLK